MLWNSARLDTCVTVVDAVNFPNYLSSLKRLEDVFQDVLDESEENEGKKSTSELIIEQVEFANVVLPNKVDLVSQKNIDISKKLIDTLNPKARVITCSRGKVGLGLILNTGIFSMKEAEQSPGWLQSLKEGGLYASQVEADEYGVSSCVYRERKPFHPNHLNRFLEQLFCFAEDCNSSSSPSNMGDRKIGFSKGIEKIYGSILHSKGTC